MPNIYIEKRNLEGTGRVPIALIEITCCAECPYLKDIGANHFLCPFTDEIFSNREIKEPGLPETCYLRRYQEYMKSVK